MNILTVTEQIVADLSSALKKVEKLPLNHNRLETQKAILDASLLALSIVDRGFVGERVEDGLSVDEISEKIFGKGKADQPSGTSSSADEEATSDGLISVTDVLHGKTVSYKLKGAAEDEVAGLSKLVLETKILEAAFDGKDPSHVPVIEFTRNGEHNFELSVAMDDGSRVNVEADAVPEDTDEAAYWAAKDAAEEPLKIIEEGLRDDGILLRNVPCDRNLDVILGHFAERAGRADFQVRPGMLSEARATIRGILGVNTWAYVRPLYGARAELTEITD